MLHNLTGGRWGYAIRRPLESAYRTLPLLLVLFLPIFFGIHKLYDWSHSDEPLKSHQRMYLQSRYFILRSVIYFAIWIAFAFLVNRPSHRPERTPDTQQGRRWRKLSSLGLVVYAFTLSFAAIDWVMSLEHQWYSTVIGMLFIAGQACLPLRLRSWCWLTSHNTRPPPSRFHQTAQ